MVIARSIMSNKSPLTDDQANVLVGACNLLDVIKGEWGESWSEWDQSIRDGLSAMLLQYYAQQEPAGGEKEEG